MSELKDEEMVEQGLGSGSGSGSSPSSASEQLLLVDAEVELEESPPPAEEPGNHSGSSDSSKVVSDEGDKTAELAEEADALVPRALIVDESHRGAPAPILVVDESNASVVQTEVFNANAAVDDGHGIGGWLVDKGNAKIEESTPKMEESNHLEVPKTGDSNYAQDKVNVALAISVNASGDNAVPVGNPIGNGVKEVNPVKYESTPSTSRVLMTQALNFAYPTTLHMGEEDDGTEEEQIAFLREVETFCRERNLEFKHPKFYGEGLNCLKLWRAVTRLGGYDRVTACKLWRQVGESFHPPKTCTTVSWSFRIFYEKSLLDYERHKLHGGEFVMPASPNPEPASADALISGQQGSSGRQRRDAAARAMQGWHFRLHANGEIGDSIIKDKNPLSTPRRDKQVKSSVGLLKRKKPSSIDRSVKAARTATKVSKPQIDIDVIDIGTPAADWVKINVLKTKDCFEVYALVPGLLREEVRVQSDPVGRLVISGDPEQPDNPWGVTPFKKVITLPARIDPHHTSAVVTLHGQLFVRVPFEQADL